MQIQTCLGSCQLSCTDGSNGDTYVMRFCSFSVEDRIADSPGHMNCQLTLHMYLTSLPSPFASPVAIMCFLSHIYMSQAYRLLLQLQQCFFRQGITARVNTAVPIIISSFWLSFSYSGTPANQAQQAQAGVSSAIILLVCASPISSLSGKQLQNHSQPHHQLPFDLQLSFFGPF